jgi:ArsR family transcriptional regulator, arsenate/arsenite/antimonite-responsive transcriptional repressor
METDMKEYAARFKALSDPTRLQIIEILSCGELCACDILESFQITQPTLSYHMKSLTESGFVMGEKRGSWMYYRLDVEALENVSAFIEEISHGGDSCSCNNLSRASRDRAANEGNGSSDGIEHKHE